MTVMTPDTANADETTNTARARNEGSGLFAIDVREGFERVVPTARRTR
jgi:hypothetical protein